MLTPALECLVLDMYVYIYRLLQPAHKLSWSSPLKIIPTQCLEGQICSNIIDLTKITNNNLHTLKIYNIATGFMLGKLRGKGTKQGRKLIGVRGGRTEGEGAGGMGGGKMVGVKQ